MRKRLIVMAVLAGCGGDDVDPLRVELDSGPIRGIADDGARHFYGIPYAAPPTGANRWRPPQPVTPWAEERSALNFGSGCVQAESLFGGAGDEDCLTLNVWTPEAPPAEPAPVFVWIHGGAFTAGSGDQAYYDGSVLAADNGLVVVTINYRIGLLGFLAHPALSGESDDGVSGNYGLLDQRAALAWVQRNIAAFGGDPTRVALAGESAGGASTCIHYLSPDTADLFEVAISQSGACLGGLAEPTLADGEASGEAVAATLGCDTAACLRDVAPADLVAALSLGPIADQPPGGPVYIASPIVGPLVDGVVYPEPMATAFAGSDHGSRPLLLGSNRDEGVLFHGPLLSNDVEDEAEYRAALAVRFGDDADAIVAQYPVAAYEDANDALTHVTTDSLFVCPARRTARAAEDAGAAVYLYSFEHEPEGASFDGAFHAAEIPFVFGVELSEVGRIGAAAPLSAAMRGYWTRFATTGDPNVPAGDDVAWPAYDAAGDAHLTLAVPIAAGAGLAADACDFWDAR